MPSELLVGGEISPSTGHSGAPRLQVGPSAQVVDDVHHRNLHSRPGDSDGAHQHTAHGGLGGEHVFNARPNLGSPMVRLGGPFGQFPLGRALGLDVAAVTSLFQFGLLLRRAVGRVRPHIGAGVGLVQQRIEHLAVVNGGIGHLEVTDQLVLSVDADVVLVPEVGLAVLLRPACICVLLSPHHGLVVPALRRLTFLDRLVLVPAVALARRGDHARIDDLPAPRDVAGRLDLHHQFGEQLFDQFQRLQPLTKQPDGLSIRHSPFGCQSQKAAEGVAVAYLVLGLVVSQVVEVLQHQHLEHQHHIERLAPGVALTLLLMHLLKHWAEALPVDHFGQFRQWVAQLFQLLVAFVKIEESGLHRASSCSCVMRL